VGKIRSLQILRFAAALAVVVAHAFSATNGLPGLAVSSRIQGAGTAGVDVFFVLSGAIIFKTAFDAGKPLSAWTFWRRRYLRVAPIYYLATLAWLPVAVLVLGQTVRPTWLLATVTFWPAWDVITAPELPIGWTLCFEMLFYTAAALILASRRWLWAVAVGFPAAWLLRDITGLSALRFLGNPIVLEFLFGVAVMRWAPKSAPWWFAAGLIVLGVGGILGLSPPSAFYDLRATLSGNASVFRMLLWGAPAAMIVAGALSLERFAVGPVSRVFTYLGDASYSLYLTHYVLIKGLTPWVRSSLIDARLMLLALVVLSVTVACAVYELAEKSLLRAVRTKVPRSGLAGTPTTTSFQAELRGSVGGTPAIGAQGPEGGDQRR